MRDPYPTLIMLAIVGVLGWGGYNFVRWVGHEEVLNRTPHFKAGECIIGTAEREPWESSVDYYIQQVGKFSYLLVTPETMAKRNLYRPLPALSKSMGTVNRYYTSVPCPEKW